MIYLIHFVDPLSHAQHYLGSTEDLPHRIWQHAHGWGSALTRHLCLEGLEWYLVRLWTEKRNTARWNERKFKSRKNGRIFCPVCNVRPASPQFVEEYPIKLLPIPVDSSSLKHLTWSELCQLLRTDSPTTDPSAMESN